MKKLVCEICQSTSFIKQDGNFICQGCGMKYALDEVKRMTEDSDKIHIDHTPVPNMDGVDKMYVLARRAKETRDFENAKSYYEMIVVSNPYDWEAVFYSAYFKAVTGRTFEIPELVSILRNKFETLMQLVFRLPNEQWEKTLDEMGSELVELAKTLAEIAIKQYHERMLMIKKALSALKKSGAKDDGRYKQEKKNCIEDAVSWLLMAANLLYYYGLCVIKVFGEMYAEEIVVPIWSEGLVIHEGIFKIKRGYRIDLYNHYCDLRLKHSPRLQREAEIKAEATEREKKKNAIRSLIKTANRIPLEKYSFAKVGKVLLGIAAGLLLVAVLCILVPGEEITAEELGLGVFGLVAFYVVPLTIGGLFCFKKRPSDKQLELNKEKKRELLEKIEGMKAEFEAEYGEEFSV